eukprot:GFYU01005480.1.p1 GENE.GFYU01005480.1~~GFYU01005480.1.p1  ORF type:complete len:385 (+),score=131.10 GFYU01005480.1:250-1404(+)
MSRKGSQTDIFTSVGLDQSASAGQGNTAVANQSGDYNQQEEFAEGVRDLTDSLFHVRGVLDDALNETQASINDRLAEIHQTEAYIVELEDKVKSKDIELSRRAKEIETLRNQVQATKADGYSASVLEKEGKEKVNQLQNELELEQNRLNKITTTATVQIEALKKENEALKVELKELRGERKVLSQEVDTAKRATRAAESDKNKRFGEIRKMREELNHVRAELGAVKSREKDALLRVQELETDLTNERHKTRENEALMQREVMYMEQKLAQMLAGIKGQQGEGSAGTNSPRASKIGMNSPRGSKVGAMNGNGAVGKGTTRPRGPQTDAAGSKVQIDPSKQQEDAELLAKFKRQNTDYYLNTSDVAQPLNAGYPTDGDPIPEEEEE